MKKKVRKPRVQRTFGYAALGVEIHLYKDATKAGAALLVTDLNTIKGNKTEFGLVAVRLANNLDELKKITEAVSAARLVANYALMFGTRLIERTPSLKKAEKYLEG
ncbi:TPA: hypothetical protein DHW62_03000 [candidate division WWE3 bacterium]|uniref:Uncharacterized protein n=1 Tax=candidate division WWE3 bacterium TaxID=2053526 RepID=A0A656PMT0_UNCKA|nr:hypothetical protein P147_WWE3C00001G0539 [candidate division WWE3 bacterium RAAC2_WWE3_1]KKS29023.1 MAG: hypothetical protein UU91_C0010G0018 [candidate division WWE3 bacterium GW2011_GWB1_42_117]KKS55105.1 MAG: hypothetical protein UV21_C0003G0119 [candidate division WWE3 bacterium GW2011_GWD2_42_34]KKT05021.1 MAG: hypothetical protein UV83_C0007G0016 [candidate division WWE3 bacterium GW2011_GWE2_43_18]KKT06334.1 MAG: hypothetical protein UV84_C0009G0017 [candidate division WWE3 bacterium